MSENTVKRNNPLFHKGEYTDEKGRDYFFDNAKFLLIMMVVIGHFLEPLQSTIFSALYIGRVFNVLHMPCMIIISGYFSKKYINNGIINVNRPFTYTILFLVAQAAFTAYTIILGGVKSPTVLLPKTGLWYLQCLIIWCLVLPLIDRIKPKYALIGSIVFGLLIGYDTNAGHLISISRSITYLPYFLIGYYTNKETVQKLFTNKAKIIASVTLIIGLAACYFTLPYGFGTLFTGRINYWNLGFLQSIPIPLWWTARLFAYICSLLLCFSFLVFVPRCWNIFTRFGSRTLQVYILHLYITYAFSKYNSWWEPFNSNAGAFILIGISIVITIILSLKLFSYPFIWLQSIKIKPLLKPDSQT